MNTSNSFDKLEGLVKELNDLHEHERECLQSALYVKDSIIFGLESKVEKLEKIIVDNGISISGSPIKVPS